MALVEEDFPRGGKAKKTAENKAVVPQTTVDNLFQTHKPKETTKRKGVSKEDGKKAKKQKTGKDALTLNVAPKSVEILHFKNIKEGMLMLGCVKEVSDFDVTVSLPCGVQGFLGIKNISDTYTKLLSEQLDTDDTEEFCSLPHLFIPGMVLRCVVARIDVTKGGSASIQMSINPKLVNKALTSGSLKAGMVLSGCVESVEDHGYIVDIGISGTKAFLPQQAVKDIHNNPAELKVGQYVTSKLEEVKNDGRVVRLTVSPLALAQACAETQHGWSLTNLLPGLLVKAQIQKVTKHGLILNFLSSFSGQVDFLHMDSKQASTYAVADEVRACVLYMEPSTRLVGLSLRNYLIHPGTTVDAAPPGGDRIGEVVEGCKLTAMHHLSGAMLELPDKTVAFVHKNHLKESHLPAKDNQLMNVAEHTCRIMDFSPMDQLYFVSLRKSVIEKLFFRYHDLQAGQLVEGTVSALQGYGMMVNLSDCIKGMVPRTHLSDIVLQHPEKKYTEGMKVQCRVLSVDAEKKQLKLTRKKTLVQSTLPLFLSYSDARRGLVSHGCIVCIKDFGCIVRFYNDVKGLVPVNELSATLVLNPKEVFYIGQVLKVQVLHCDPESKKLVLSFKAVIERDTETPPKPIVDFEAGKKLEAKVLRKSLNGVEVGVLPEETHVLLSTMHLSDHTSNCLLLWEALREGDIISDLVCLSNNKQKITLTKKPIIKWSLEEGLVAKDFSDITVGMQLIGWIKNIMPYGVFVEFPYGLFGLAPKSAMSDKFIMDTASAFQLGQTVFAKVTNLDVEKHRFLVTLKVSEVIVPKGDAQTRLIRGLQERRAVAEILASRANSEHCQQLSALSVGQKLKLSVDDVEDGGGATFKSDDLTDTVIQATKHHVMGANLTPGQKVTAVILYVDILSSRVFVSVLPKLVGKKKSLAEGSSYMVIVQHIDKEFAVISLEETAQLTVIQSTGHLNELESEKLKLGMYLRSTVIESSCEELGGLPLVSWERVNRKHHRMPSESQTSHKGYCYGDIVKGRVRTVKPTCVLVTLADGSTGSVHVSEVSDGACLGTFPTSSVKVGSEVTAMVIGGREATSHRFLPFSHAKFKYTIPELTLQPSKLDKDVDPKPLTTQEKLSRYKAGEEIRCFVSKYYPERKFLEVTVDPCITGTVELLAMITDVKYANHPEKLYKLGQAVSGFVVEVTPKPQRLIVSLTGIHMLEKGSVTLGMVNNVQPHVGLQVKLPFGGKGIVSVMDLADNYRPKPLDAYSKDQLIRCYLIGKEDDKWRLSLRPSRLNPEQAKPVKDPEISSIEELKVGQIIRGYVKSVGEQGIFIRLSQSIIGRAQLQQSTKYFVSSHSILKENLPLNTLLTIKILSIEKEEQLVNLSLLPEDTGKPDVLPESLALPLRLVGAKKKEYDVKRERKRVLSQSLVTKKDQTDEVPKKKKKKAKKGSTEDNDSGVEVYFREGEDEKEEQPIPGPSKVKPSPVGPARLQVSAGFSWDVGLNTLKPASVAQEGDSSDGEDHEKSTKPQKKSRHELALEKKEAEKALFQREAELMDPNLRPQDAGAFERLLLASPNSSLLWLQYMAHHLQATQIEQARAVAERALKTISFREEQEKLNVWVALLNLENLYGSDESLKKVFERALQFCEPMPVYQQLADIYAKSNKTKEAEDLYKKMVKRFRQDKAVWLSYGAFLLQQGQGDATSALLQRALKSLPSKESVDVITKFAQLEFRYGDAERARSMFDKVLSNYPKRTDLWSVFIDLMIKHGSQSEVRALFDRVIHLSLAVKRIKFFFKRYLEYEKKHGTPASIQAVKEKALEFVENKVTEAAC